MFVGTAYESSNLFSRGWAHWRLSYLVKRLLRERNGFSAIGTMDCIVKACLHSAANYSRTCPIQRNIPQISTTAATAQNTPQLNCSQGHVTPRIIRQETFPFAKSARV